jgi:hypothetical protein
MARPLGTETLLRGLFGGRMAAQTTQPAADEADRGWRTLLRGLFGGRMAAQTTQPAAEDADLDWGAAIASGPEDEGGDLDVDNVNAFLDAAQDNPDEVVWFLKAVLLLGVAIGAVLPAPCGAFLVGNWEACALCSRPLHIWILVHCSLQFLLAPVRFSFFCRLWRGQRQEANVQECLRQLMLSKSWAATKAASVASNAWLVVGLVWLLNSNFCRPCPWLYALTCGVMATALAKPLATLLLFRRLLPLPAFQPASAAPRGARSQVIGSLPRLAYEPELLCEKEWQRETSCAVCLCDFQRGDELRQLPCGHTYHVECVDRWLCKSKVCPLCMHDIELPPISHPRLKKKVQ